jgi:cytochrome c556
MKRHYLIAGLLAGVASLGVAPVGVALAQTALQDIIVTRQAGMALQQAAFDSVKLALEAKLDPKPQAGAAEAMAFWSSQIPTVFPPGSEKGHETRAKPEVWSDNTGFVKDSNDTAAAAKKLADLLKAGDADGAAAQLKVLDRACVACHRSYRARAS